MNYLIFGTCVFVAVLLFKCSNDHANRDNPPEPTAEERARERYIVIEIDGCQYIKDNSGVYNPPLIHKANCPNHTKP